ncbi:MAG TPA: YCF48-related protein [Terriglobales bacterium]|nr:YCF48-related protein [Terriglobales bacterium]
MPDLPKSVLGRMQAQAAPRGHPTADLLAAFSEQALTGRERENVLAHLAVCAACREALALASPQPVAVQPGGVFVPWYRRPSIFAWAGTLATVAVVGALVLNYSQSRYSTATFSDATPTKVARTPPAENKPAGPATQAEVSGGLAGRAQTARRDADQAKAEPPLKKGAEERGRKEIYAASTPAQAPAKDEKKLDGGMLQGQLSAMKTPAAAAAHAPEAQAAPAPQAVVAANAMEEKQQVAAGKEADKLEGLAAERSKSANVAASAGFGGGTLSKSKAALPTPVFRWSISDKGKLQRSRDQGRTWTPVLASEATVFRAVAVVGNEVWAGGSAATLLHSADGASWTRQTLPGAAADVVTLQFSDSQHGTARTADGVPWTTSDGGQHWTRQ